MNRWDREVADLYGQIDAAAAMEHVRRLTAFDRYQGSAGIAGAAAYVADEARRAGLVDVEVWQLPADGRTAWWTFTAPAPWTPRSAALTLPATAAAPETTLTSYPDRPYSLAAGSASTKPGAPPLQLADAAHPRWPPGALILVPDPALLGPDLYARLRRERAAGIAVLTLPGRPGRVGRLELPAGAALFGFSLDTRQFAALRAAARAGIRARARVEADTTEAAMPVVVARTPTGGDAECLLTAHLCHPAPSANDNASGVAATLAAARVLAARPLRRAVRFVWGPEFVGLAAYLHRRAATGAPRPLLALNLDMAGEDQRRCGGPLIIEHAPEHLPHYANAVLEACVTALPQAAASYSGAVPCDTWAWRATPFVGASDHALPADRSVGCPALQIGHWPDRHNHSSTDTLDKVDPAELRRSAALAGAALAAVCAADAQRAADLAPLVARWGAARLVHCLPGAGEPGEPDPAWAHPADPGLRAQLLRQRYANARGALLSLAELGAPDAAVEAQTALLRALYETLAAGLPAERPPAAPGPPLERSWPGPFNLRALMHACTPADRHWLQERLTADRGRFYATAAALAQGIDGHSDARRIAVRAALDTALPIHLDSAHRFLDAMTRAGWATPRPDEGWPT